MAIGRIGVLMGGPSTEREISLKSGMAVYESLRKIGVEAVPIDIKKAARQENIRMLKKHRIDCAFLALHGAFGEDGQIQEILEALKIPYTCSGATASRLAIDKIASRRIFQVYGLDVPRYKVLDILSYCKDWNSCPVLSFPLVIKPVTQGSSIGLSIVNRGDDLDKAITLAFKFGGKIIAEEHIKGRELTVGILNDEALPVVEVIPKKGVFDYEAKYLPGLTEYKVPADLNEDTSAKVKRAALAAHRLLGCLGCSRVDIILDLACRPVILEVNTIPGLTATSLLPKAARCVGVEFDQLCLKLIASAYEKAKV